jgi:hypothetical protein
MGWDISFKQSLVYRLKNYDINVIFEKPNELRVRKEALEGRVTYVVISNNLMESENNILFLQATGQGSLLKDNERMNLIQQRTRFAEKSNDIDAGFKIKQVVNQQTRGKRMAALLKPAAKISQNQNPPEKYEPNRANLVRQQSQASITDFDRLNALFHLLLVDRPVLLSQIEELVVRQKLGIFNKGAPVTLHDLVMPIDLQAFTAYFK